MKKFKSLLKAMFSQDMNFFKFRVKPGSSKVKKILFPTVLAIVVMLAIGVYAYMFAEPLSEAGLTYIMLTIFMTIITMTSFIEGIYKSQGILFECKDNDLLFSLPIEKSKIFALRIIKLLTFQFIYNLFFMIPAYIVYIYFEKPEITFYITSILMLFLLPIIPTILAVILGYIIKGISVKFKAKKIVQTVLSLVLFIVIFFLSYNIRALINNITQNATSINEILTKIYYPIGEYINLIQKFNIIELLKLIAVNIIPLILVIYIGSINYFKIISKSKTTNNSNTKIKVKTKIKARSQIRALVKKELTKFFSTPVYMFNTSFGIFIMLIATVALSINTNGIINMILNNEGLNISVETIYNILPKIYIQLVILVGCTTSITSSSISLEGKSFNITKSLPIKEEKILLAKVISSDVISLPLMFLSNLIFFINFKINYIDMFIITAYTILIPTIIAIIGLLINLKYPKMNASSDTEVVKQSMSSTISVLIGMLIFGISTIITVKMFSHIEKVILVELAVFTAIVILLYIILKTYGKKRIRQINI